VNQLDSEIRQLLLDNGVEMLDFHLSRHSGHVMLRVVADRRTEGLKIDDCAILSRQIKHLIDEKALLKDDYRLEVSSPGLDYPLREDWQFTKNIKRLLKVQVPGEKGPREINGRLLNVSETGITLVADKTEWNLRFEEILSAKVLPELKSSSVESKR
jgi:ribosome maturation factor RimP